MTMLLFFNKLCRFFCICLLYLFSLNLSFAQQLIGKWKCSEDTMLEMGLGYKSISGKCHFKKNGTFTIRIKGRSLLGHKFWRYQTMSAKVKGKYILDGNNITSMINTDAIKVDVDSGMEDPELNQKTKEAEKYTTWDSARRTYEMELYYCGVQEQVIKEKILNLWTWNKLQISHADTGNIYIGNMIMLKK